MCEEQVLFYILRAFTSSTKRGKRELKALEQSCTSTQTGAQAHRRTMTDFQGWPTSVTYHVFGLIPVKGMLQCPIKWGCARDEAACNDTCCFGICHEESARSLVFCNKIEACRDVENYLRRHFEGENMKVWCGTMSQFWAAACLGGLPSPEVHAPRFASGPGVPRGDPGEFAACFHECVLVCHAPRRLRRAHGHGCHRPHVQRWVVS
eukprot:837273-Pelagomonas_calceolata.AAC.1